MIQILGLFQNLYSYFIFLTEGMDERTKNEKAKGGLYGGL